MVEIRRIFKRFFETIVSINSNNKRIYLRSNLIFNTIESFSDNIGVILEEAEPP